MNLSHTCKYIANLPGYVADTATGQIYNAVTGRALRGTLSRSSCRYYCRVNIARRTRLVHRLVMTAQLGRVLARAEHVRHLDGDPANNRAGNLALGSARDNARDRLAHGTNGKRLRNNHVREIRVLSRRVTPAVLAARYGVSVRHIQAIRAGHRWAGLPM